MDLDGALGQVHLGGDLPVGFGRRDVVEHLEFAVGEHLEDRGPAISLIRVGQQRDEPIDHAPGGRRRQDRITGGDRADRGQ